MKKYITDCILLLGSAVVFYGIFAIYPPAAFIGLGAGLIFYAIQTERGK